MMSIRCIFGVMTPSTVRVTLRLPSAVYDALKNEALLQERSLNGQIVHLLRLALELTGEDRVLPDATTPDVAGATTPDEDGEA